MSGSVLAIVLNYKRPEDTIECIASLKKSDYRSLQILVVDNASSDGSSDLIRRSHPDVEIFENGENLGYAGGNNAGLRLAVSRGYDYAFILNNDATVKDDTIQILVEEAEKNVSATILAPKICIYGDPRRLNSAGTSMDWLRLRPYKGLYGRGASLVSDEPVKKDILPGSALLVKCRLLPRVGYFNEGYFLIHEDADLCYRNRREGFANVVVPRAVVYHKESKTLSSFPFLTEYYSTRNFLHLAAQHAGALQRMACAAGVFFYLIRNAVKLPFAGGADREKIKGFFAGLRDFLAKRQGPYGVPT